MVSKPIAGSIIVNSSKIDSLNIHLDELVTSQPISYKMNELQQISEG